MTYKLDTGIELTISKEVKKIGSDETPGEDFYIDDIIHAIKEVCPRAKIVVKRLFANVTTPPEPRDDDDD